MKLSGRMMVAVAMMLGSLSAVGCNRSPSESSALVDPQAQATAATATNDDPVEAPTAATPAVVAAVQRVQPIGASVVVAPMAPPPVRYEDPGVAPSTDDVFVSGYWRWDGRRYDWIGGHWAARREASDCVRPTYVAVGGRWEERPVRWGDHHDGDRHEGDRHDGHDGDRHASSHDGDHHDVAPATGDHHDGAKPSGGHSELPKLAAAPSPLRPVMAQGETPAAKPPHRAPPRTGGVVRTTGPIPRGHG